MNDVDALLDELGERARRETLPDIDVRARVMQSVSTVCVKADWFPVVCGSVSFVVAAALLMVCLPSWHTMFDPWAGFFVH